MKKLIFLFSFALLFVAEANGQIWSNKINMTISAADDTIASVDTAYLYADFGAGQNYGYTLTLTGTEAASGTLAGAGITLWGRNADTETWTQLTASNYYTAMQGADSLTDGNNQHTYLVSNHRFSKLRARVITSSGTVAYKGVIHLQVPAKAQ